MTPTNKKSREQSLKTDNQTTMIASKRRPLTRSHSDRMIAGVAGGLAEYLELDSTLVRVILLLMAVFGGSGVLIYLILWLIMPLAPSGSETSLVAIPDEDSEDNSLKSEIKPSPAGVPSRDSGRPLWGFLLLGLGVLFLLQNFGILRHFDLGRLWPVFLIGLGLTILLKR